MNPRKLALTALLKVETEGAYSNLTLNNIFKSTEISSEDKALASALFYGVLDRKITIDYYLSSLVKTPLKKVSPYTLTALRIGIYQIKYMDKIPESAAVNESVKLVKASKESRNSGFVNAVLRNVLRKEILMPSGDSVKDLSVIYSAPEWIIKSFINDYGKENALKLLDESLKPAPIILRVNTLKISTDDLIKEFEKINIDCEKINDFSICLKKGIDIKGSPLYKRGYFYAQDLASQTAVKVLNPTPCSRVFDMCASPGGKSFSMALLMENKGEIISTDLYEQRVKLIENSKKRLSLDIIKPMVMDATTYSDKISTFDYILCDVPCSGLGIMRRKPDIKYKEVKELDDLPIIQEKILMNALKYIKKGGKILYSTCTLRKAENENVVDAVLQKNINCKKLYEHSFMPHIDNTDGFYCALIECN